MSLVSRLARSATRSQMQKASPRRIKGSPSAKRLKSSMPPGRSKNSWKTCGTVTLKRFPMMTFIFQRCRSRQNTTTAMLEAWSSWRITTGRTIGIDYGSGSCVDTLQSYLVNGGACLASRLAHRMPCPIDSCSWSTLKTMSISRKESLI